MNKAQFLRRAAVNLTRTGLALCLLANAGAAPQTDAKSAADPGRGVPNRAAGPPRAGRFSFGWGHESIVPGKPVAIAGQYFTRISGEVLDPITVTALAMETRDEQGAIDQVVWVSCDLVGIRAKTVEGVRRKIAPVLADLDPGKIIVSTTHTHTAPAITDADETDLHPYDFAGSWAYRMPADQPNVMRSREYLEFLEQQIAKAVISAWQSRKPGAFSHARSRVGRSQSAGGVL
ncbi:MAG: hypothetical protein L0Z50_39580 [Verrucomicrobiales bacterium]|nr:hypothetical protein [Verrucomicrobiales bacterium]